MVRMEPRTENTEVTRFARHRRGVARRLDELQAELRQLRVEVRQVIETKAAVRNSAKKEEPTP